MITFTEFLIETSSDSLHHELVVMFRHREKIKEQDAENLATLLIRCASWLNTLNKIGRPKPKDMSMSEFSFWNMGETRGQEQGKAFSPKLWISLLNGDLNLRTKEDFGSNVNLWYQRLGFASGFASAFREMISNKFKWISKYYPLIDAVAGATA